jgi:hypothetical protein
LSRIWRKTTSRFSTTANLSPFPFLPRDEDLPLSLGLIVDVSDSQEHFVKPHQRDLGVFLDSVLSPRDRAFLICFGNHLRLAADFSASGSELIDGLRQLEIANVGQGRRALIIFSDGEDNSAPKFVIRTRQPGCTVRAKTGYFSRHESR